MDKVSVMNRIKQLYLENENIMDYLKRLENKENNSIEDIMISYDFQAGSYIEEYKKNPSFKKRYCSYLANIINDLQNYESILEVGIGEGTTLGPLINSLKKRPNKCYGFDISWSRVKYARNFLNDLGIHNVELFTGDLFCTPLKDNSIDIVYTSHSIEPNGGREREALIELYRITSKYLILIEPSYEFANGDAKKRMLRHGYVTNLYSTAKELGYDIIAYRLFGISANSLNPTGLMVIRKGLDTNSSNPLCCPITKSDILKKDNAYFSKEGLVAYPIIDKIPCLLSQNAIIATKFLD